jgi:hypothetical protein
MISSKIFCISLLSLSWISAVRAVPTDQQIAEMKLFVENIKLLGSLGAAYAEVDKQKLDAYLSEYIDQVYITVEHYLGNLPEAVRNGQGPAPAPEKHFQDALNWFPMCVDFIWYVNLNIINDLKKTWLSVYPQSLDWLDILAKIDDTYLTEVSEEYDDTRVEPGTLFQLGTHLHRIVHVAASLSMNDAMSSLLRGSYFHLMYPTLVERLERYRYMIVQLYNEMAQYMRFQIPREYAGIIQDIDHRLIELANREVLPSALHQWAQEIQQAANSLSLAILSMMAIYGPLARSDASGASPVAGTRPLTNSPPPVLAAAGTEVISDLLVRRWDVRRLMDLEPRSKASNRAWTKQLLTGLSLELNDFEHGFRAGCWWIPAIRRLLGMAISLLDSVPPLRKPSGSHGQTSGTN